MIQLIYLSRATEPMSAVELSDLCDAAARNNNRDEITGILLIEHQHFLQVLEGPKETVENTFVRIITDRRHHALLLLSRRLRTVREFGEWSMAMCDEPVERRDVVDHVRGILTTAPAGLRATFETIFPPGACRPGPAEVRDGVRDGAITRSGTAPPA